MEFACGVLRWQPEAFWRSTPLELTSAYVGYCRREGLGRWAPDSAGFNAETAEEMRRAFEANKRVHGAEHKKGKMTKEQKREYNAVIAAGGGVIRG